jgi:hypothetical protein
MWRFVATDLDSNVTTILDRVASQRHVEALLNVPNWLSFVVPSDSPLVNIPYPGPTDDPYVSEGNRLVWAFRQETGPGSVDEAYFEPRAAGVCLQVEDTAEQDVARTKVVAYDPWKVAAFRPAQDVTGELPSPAGDWDGVYAPGVTADFIIIDQLDNTIANNGPMFLDITSGHIETTAALTDGFTVTQGMSVADVMTAMVNTATCDIVLTPIWDPIGRPGITHELNIYSEAGTDLPDNIFGWDRPPHSLTSLSRMFDGTLRANKIRMGAGLGGSEGFTTLETDASSVTKYGEYWDQRFLPGSLIVEALQDMASFQLTLRKNGRTIVQFSPTPERSPCPFVDYLPGDRVPVYATGGAFRQDLAGYVRIYGVPIDISDDALETVRGMILLPVAS